MNECPDRLAILAELFRVQLGLKKDRVFIYNQPWEIPPDEKLFVEVALLSSPIYASSLEYTGTPDTVTGNTVETGQLTETISVNSKEIYTFDLFSVNAEARQNRARALSALNSTLAQQICEQYSFTIASLPTQFIDLSETEASRRLNRFQGTFTVLAADSFTQPVPYFDKFTTYPGPNLIVQP